MRTQIILGSVVSLFVLTSCGLTLEDGGSAAQAKKDLATVNSAGADSAAEAVSYPASDGGAPAVPCHVVAPTATTRAVDCGNSGVLTKKSPSETSTGRWVWVADDGYVSGQPQKDDGVEADSGSWHWMTADGLLPADLAVSAEWQWVSDEGALSKANATAGGWFLLSSVGQIGTAPSPDSVFISRPGSSHGGWYWTPSGGQVAPVFGGIDAVPVPPAVPNPAPTTPPAGSGGSGSGSGSGKTRCSEVVGAIGSVLGVNGRLEPAADECATPFTWTVTNDGGASTGATSFTVQGVADLGNEGTTAADFDVVIQGGVRSVKAVRVRGAGGATVNSILVQHPSGQRCVSGVTGVQIRLGVSGRRVGSSTATICDNELASLLIG